MVMCSFGRENDSDPREVLLIITIYIPEKEVL